MNPGICQISGEAGGDLVTRQSRLIPSQTLIVKKDYYDKGYEPAFLVLTYGRSLVADARKMGQGTWALVSKDTLFNKIIEKKLYFGDEITMRQLL
jgi:hypothetical protein